MRACMTFVEFGKLTNKTANTRNGRRQQDRFILLLCVDLKCVVLLVVRVRHTDL